MKVSEQLRAEVAQAISNGRETRYSIAKGAEVGYTNVLRWFDGGADPRMSTIDAICKYMGLELRRPKK